MNPNEVYNVPSNKDCMKMPAGLSAAVQSMDLKAVFDDDDDGDDLPVSDSDDDDDVDYDDGDDGVAGPAEETASNLDLTGTEDPQPSPGLFDLLPYVTAAAFPAMLINLILVAGRIAGNVDFGRRPCCRQC